MSTVTSTLVAAGVPRAVHAGANVAYVEYATTASLTAASVIQLIPLPDRARIVDGWVVTPNDSFKLSVGDSDDPDRYIVSATNAAVTLHRFSAVTIGHQMSISQTDAIRWRSLDALIGSAAATGTFRASVTYYMDT